MAFHLVQASERGREFLDRLERTSGTVRYFNSGVQMAERAKTFIDARTGARSTRRFIGAYEFLGDPTENFSDTELLLPQNCLNIYPHVHPRVEVARLPKDDSGGYFDADMKGKPLVGLDGKPLVYKAGDVILYPRASIHRPLTVEGARILYYNFGGLKEIKSLTSGSVKDILIETNVPENAAEYAMMLLFPDNPEKRQRILDEIFHPELVPKDY